MKSYIISALVKNRTGVLNKVAGLFSKRSYNIASLTVAETENQDASRMTIVARGDDSEIEQIIKQLDKLIDTINVVCLNTENSVMRELLLIKIKVKPEQRPEIESTIRAYKAKSIDLSETTQTIELTGEGNKTDSFIKILAPYGILEMARTGVTALERGESVIIDHLSPNER